MAPVPVPGDVRVLAGARVVTPDGVLSPGWIQLAGDLIDAVGRGDAKPGLPVADLHGQWVVPGFVDMHVHGGGGTSFTAGSADDARRAAEFHRGHGTTSIVASLVTAPLAELESRAAMLAGLAAEGVIAGLHLEGPFLSAARCGAQDPRHMIAPDVAVFERLRATAAGHLKVLTIAPELPGATEVIKAAARAASPSPSGTPTPPPRWPRRPSTPARLTPRICSTACARCITASPGPPVPCLTEMRSPAR